MEKTKEISLNEEELEVLRKFQEEKRKKLLAELQQTDSKLSLYNNSNPKQSKIPFPGYDKSAQVPVKIALIVKEFGKCVTAREIFEKMVEYEPELAKDRETEHLKHAHVSSAILSKVNSNKVLFRYTAENGVFKVGLIEWRGENGEPKEMYK